MNSSYEQIDPRQEKHEDSQSPDFSESEGDSFLKDDSSGRSSLSPRRVSTSLILNVAILLCNILFLCTTIFLRSYQQCQYGANGPDLVHTPMKDAISYTLDDLVDRTTYSVNGTAIPDEKHPEWGPPGPETDQAWADIVQYSNIRLSREELGEDYQDNSGLVEFSDGSGIYGSVAVYHSVHCIKRVHHLLHPDYYYPNMSEKTRVELQHHAQHCLQYLLDSAKCNADLTVFPMQWGETTRIPFGIDAGRHQCKDWSRIEEWSKSRSVDIYQPGLLIHPTLGWAYTEGAENVTGVAHDTLIDHGH